MTEKLMVSEIRYRRLFESAKDGILILDAETGKIVDVNPFLIDLLGYSKEEFIEKRIWEIGAFQDIYENKNKFLELQQEEYVRYDDLPLVTSDGRKIHVEFISNVYLVENHKVIQCQIRDITEQRSKEDSLKETNRATSDSLNSLLNHIQAPIIIWDTSMIIKRFNRQFELLSGYDSAEVIGKKIDFLFPKEKIEPTLNLLKNHLDDEHLEIAEIAILTKDNHIKTVLWNSSHIRDEEGKNIIATISHDITTRRQSELALRKSESHLRALVNTIPDLIWLKDPNGVYLSCNPMFGRFYGAGETDIIGKTDYDFVDRKVVGFFRENDRKAIEAGKPVSNEEWITYADDGHRAFLETIKTPIYDSEGTLLGVLGVGRDITERKQAEKKLKNSEEKFRSYIENAPNGVFVADEKGRFIEVDKSACRMLGYSEDELLKFSISDILSKESFEDGMNHFKSLQHKAIKKGDFLFKCKDGGKKWFTLDAVKLNETRFLGFASDMTERKRAEMELVKLSRAVEQSPASVIITDLKGSIEYINPKTLETTGYTKEELIGKNPRIFSSGEKPKTEYEQLWNTISTGNEWYGEFHNKKKNGELYWESASISPIINEKQEIINYLAIKEDITEQKKFIQDLKIAKEKAEESEGKLKEAQRIAHIGNWELSIENNELFWSDEIYRIFDCELQEFNATYEAFLEFIHPDDREKVNSAYLNSLETKTEYQIEHRLITKNNQLKYVREKCKTTFNEQGELLNSIGIVIDITEQKALENELIKAKEKAEESEEKHKEKHNLLSNFIKHTPIYSFIKHVEPNLSKVMYASENYVDMTGIAASEMIGKTMYELFPHEFAKKITSDDWEVINNGKILVLDEDLNDKNYTTIKFPIVSDNKKFLAGFTIDITERKKNEIDLIIAKEKAEESDRLKSAFLANMSHEIRTPMNGILGFTNLLLEPDLSSEQKENFIKIVHQSGQRMLNTVNDLVEISKIEAGLAQLNLTETDVNERIEELFRFFQPGAEKKGLKLSVEMYLPQKDKNIITDQNKLDSILTNLIKNAIKYTESGTIKVGCKTVKTHNNASLKFYVKDTGIGIPKNRRQAIFNRFEQADIEDTRAFEGSGLGLSIAKAYVEMLGGKIWVESNPDSYREAKGSAFFFTLPLSVQTQEKTEEKKTVMQGEKASQIKKLDIIIAEDDENSALFLQTILKKESNKILVTKNGHETVEACRNNPDTDLVLMDIQMPELNGYDATREIRKFNKNVIIIAQTAFAFSGDKQKAMDAGCNDYVAKPIIKGVLLEKIQKYFKNKM